MQIQLGPKEGIRHVLDRARGVSFCGVAVFDGTPPNATAHIFSTTTCQECTPDTAKQIDPKTLAAELGVPATGTNPGRFWMMDEMRFDAGETVDFQGVKAAWVGAMKPEDTRAILGPNPYVPTKIARVTTWIYEVGKPIYLLRQPDGKAWVLQEYCNDVDKDLTQYNLHIVGDKLKRLPAGWKFETKVLAKELSLDTSRPGATGIALILRDELGNAYQGVGFDDSANYVP